jgi:AbrB family looped-hinge helix DNA binding protein
MTHIEVITIGDRGRVVLPASLRRALALEPGTQMLATAEADGSLRLRPYRGISDAFHGILADVAPDRSLVDELLAERRAEASKER